MKKEETGLETPKGLQLAADSSFRMDQNRLLGAAQTTHSILSVSSRGFLGGN